MTSPTTQLLVGSAAAIALLHTAVGIDHYLPFIALGRARSWSLRRTLLVTGGCGVGHVAASVVLGVVGLALGLAADEVDGLQSARGSVAAWLLIGFGLAYAAWGLVRAVRGQTHTHLHVHPDGTAHAHAHDHRDEHLHVHDARGSSVSVWTLFIIFAFGPCEALIPLMMAPAVSRDWSQLALVVGVFAAVTVATMMALVALGYLGVSLARFRMGERYVHLSAGLALALAGALVQLFGL